MFPWSAFVGKLVDFLLSKLVGKQVELALDDRKRAAKAFLRFYDAIVQLELLGTSFINEVRPFLEGQKPRLYQAAFTALAKEADQESTEFLVALKQLHLIIDLYDPDLACVLVGVRAVKQGIVISSFTQCMRFGFAQNSDSVFALSYTAPSKRLLEENFRETLESSLLIARELLASNRRVVSPWADWPKDLLFEAIENNFEYGVIEANRIDQVRSLCDLLETSLPLLSQAKAKLRTFIQEKFTLEDLLYASKRRNSNS